MTEDIVERLRELIIADAFAEYRITDGRLADRLVRERLEAADKIEALERENARLRDLVKAAYDEGFNDGCDVELGIGAMPLWEQTRAYKALKEQDHG